jgi:hypothetical protein
MTSDLWVPINRYLSGFSTFYPSIFDWFGKVLRESSTGRRTILGLVSETGELEGLAITKNTFRAKLCHISIAEPARGDGRAWILVQRATQEMLSRGARRVHVTTSEEVAQKYGAFFSRCGFAKETYRNDRYRPGAAEWDWVASSETLAMRLFPLRRASKDHQPDDAWRLRLSTGHHDLELTSVGERARRIHRLVEAQDGWVWHPIRAARPVTSRTWANHVGRGSPPSSSSKCNVLTYSAIATKRASGARPTLLVRMINVG